MKQSQEAKQKNLFCFYTARGYSPEDAAKAAGYPPAECGEQAALLLGQAPIRRRCKKLSKELRWCSPGVLARAGLERLALAGADGAATLLKEDGELDEAADLYGVSEIKRPKGGGLEIRFFDRLKALSLLAELDGENPESTGSLLDALSRSARELEDGDEDGTAV